MYPKKWAYVAKCLSFQVFAGFKWLLTLINLRSPETEMQEYWCTSMYSKEAFKISISFLSSIWGRIIVASCHTIRSIIRSRSESDKYYTILQFMNVGVPPRLEKR